MAHNDEMEIDNWLEENLARIIADIAPTELLQMGAIDLAFNGVKIARAPYALPDFSKRYPLAIIALQGSDEDQAILARLRDLVADCVIAIAVTGSDLNYQALGFRHLSRDTQNQILGFDINNYKHTPDWLNSKYWANPERWGKYRW